MDSKFIVFLHGNPRLIDFVDQKWAAETLEFDEIEVDQSEKPTLDDELQEQEQPDPNKWIETLVFLKDCIH
jgi:hypothetical protein